MRRPARAAALLAAAITIAACGGTSTATSTAPAAQPTGPTAPGAATGTSPLPAVDVVDVATGDTVQLAGYLPAGKPTLVWMWAPH